MANYPTSTQRKNWIFDESELRSRRERSTDEALQRVAAAKPSADATAPSPTPPDAMDMSPGAPAQPADAMQVDREAPEAGSSRSPRRLLSVEEALTLQLYYEYQVEAIAGIFKFPDSVVATAVTYLKRFYIDNSIVEHDPRQILMACIYVACKTEESYISAEALARELKKDADAILHAEIPLLEALKFNLICFHPGRSIQGLLHVAEQEGLLERRAELGERARAWARRSLFTDAPLLHPPGRLALACLLLAARELALDFGPFLDAVAARSAASEGQTAAALREGVEAAAGLVAGAGSPPEKAACMAIDRKVRQLRKTATDTRQKAAEAKAKADDERRQRKARKRAEEERRRAEGLTIGSLAPAAPAGAPALADGDRAEGEAPPEDGSSAGKRKRALARAAQAPPPS